jgi:hypothetical protein
MTDDLIEVAFYLAIELFSTEEQLFLRFEVP